MNNYQSEIDLRTDVVRRLRPARTLRTTELKNILILLLLSCCLCSCATVFEGINKPLTLVDAPKDLTVTNVKTGKKLDVHHVDTGIEHVRNGNTVLIFKSPGVLFRPHHETVLELASGNQTRSITINTKLMVDWLIVEGIPTLFVYSALDLLMGGAKNHKPRYIDVPALFSGSPSRTQKELKEYLRYNSALENK